MGRGQARPGSIGDGQRRGGRGGGGGWVQIGLTWCQRIQLVPLHVPSRFLWILWATSEFCIMAVAQDLELLCWDLEAALVYRAFGSSLLLTRGDLGQGAGLQDRRTLDV